MSRAIPLADLPPDVRSARSGSSRARVGRRRRAGHRQGAESVSDERERPDLLAERVRRWPPVMAPALVVARSAGSGSRSVSSSPPSGRSSPIWSPTSGGDHRPRGALPGDDRPRHRRPLVHRHPAARRGDRRCAAALPGAGDPDPARRRRRSTRGCIPRRSWANTRCRRFTPRRPTSTSRSGWRARSCTCFAGRRWRGRCGAGRSGRTARAGERRPLPRRAGQRRWPDALRLHPHLRRRSTG